MERQAHRLKKGLGALGAGPARALAERLEALAREGALEGAAETAAGLERECARLADFLRR